MPVASRPGEGVYLDHEPRKLVQKALLISRTVAETPGCVGLITAEIENSPHVALGKTPRGTALEATLDLAVGCNSVSFALMSSRAEPLSFYERIVECIGSHRSFWDELLEANQDTVPGGLDVLLGRSQVARPVDPGEDAFSWARVDLSDVYQMVYIGIPLSPGSSHAPGAILHGNAVGGFADEELTDILIDV